MDSPDHQVPRRRSGLWLGIAASGQLMLEVSADAPGDASTGALADAPTNALTDALGGASTGALADAPTNALTDALGGASCDVTTGAPGDAPGVVAAGAPVLVGGNSQNEIVPHFFRFDKCPSCWITITPHDMAHIVTGRDHCKECGYTGYPVSVSRAPIATLRLSTQSAASRKRIRTSRQKLNNL